MRSWIPFLSLLLFSSLAAAQDFRDGDEIWTAAPSPAAEGVVVSRPNGLAFTARVDRYGLVRLAPGVDAQATFRALGLVPVAQIAPGLRIWRVTDARGGDGLALAARLLPHTGRGQPLVDAIPDWLLAHRATSIHVPPNDTLYSGQWFLQRIGIEDAWRLTTGSTATTVVVVDSGCDMLHPDLVANLDQGLDVIDGDTDPTPPAGEAEAEHGTACAGLVAAATDNALGIAGTCPECRLRCVRLLGAPGSLVPMSADIMAFQFALDTDAAVVSNSWGFVGHTTVPAMLAAIVTQVITGGRGGRGALVLFASGNDDRVLANDELEAVPGVITVGATNNFDEATAYSNRGDALDVVAPTGTTTTDISGAGGADPGDYTTSFSGTSSACPVAAGVAGLLVTAAPLRTGGELSDALISTAVQSPFATPDAMGHDQTYGYGLIDAAHAVRRALGMPEPTPDAGVPDSGTLDSGDRGDAGPPAATGGCNCQITPLTDRVRGWVGVSFLMGCAAIARSRRRRD